MKRFIKHFFDVKINDVVRFLTFSDLLIISGWGIVNPILAVFYTDSIKGGDVVLAGLATTVYLLVKSVLQFPIARYIDLKKGEWDDFWVMIIGSALTSICAFLYIFVTLPWQVIAVQIVAGVGAALSFPAWQAIFTRHVDRQQEGSEWSIYYTATDIGAAFAAGLGGFMAAHYGYQAVFVLVGILSLAGTIFLAGITRKLRKTSTL